MRSREGEFAYSESRMIPISDSILIRRTPWITGILLVLNSITFLYELSLPSSVLDLFIQRWGADTRAILMVLAGDPRVPQTELLTLFTSQFLHGGWLHLLGNMLFLYVFGRAVEDRLGHLVYLAVYLLGGAGAGLFQAWVSGPEAGVVLIGASGSIATVLGAYLVMFPTAWVKVVIPVLFFFWAFDVPAVLMLALWFLGQFFTGIAFMTEAAAPGNVAIWAHVGGFVLGVLVGIVTPRPALYGMGRSTGVQRIGGPGLGGLISSVAELAGLLLGARVLLHFFQVTRGPDLMGQIAAVVYAVTDPVVGPFESLIPWLVVMGMPLDLPGLAAMLFIYIFAAVLIRVLGGTSRDGSRRRR
jgi:membrane associated rhomboid family serine protease